MPFFTNHPLLSSLLSSPTPLLLPSLMKASLIPLYSSLYSILDDGPRLGGTPVDIISPPPPRPYSPPIVVLVLTHRIQNLFP